MTMIDAAYFKEMSENHGVAPTTVEFWGRIPKDVLAGLTPDWWKEVYNCAADDHPAKLVAFEKANADLSFGLAVDIYWMRLPPEFLDQFSFAHWKKVVQCAPDGLAKSRAKDMLIKKATTFNQLLEIVSILSCQDEKMPILKAKMREIAKTPWEFVWVWIVSDPAEKEEIEKVIEGLTANIREWWSALAAAPPGCAIQKIARNKIVELSK